MFNNQVLIICQPGLFIPLLLSIVQFIVFFIYVHEFIYGLDLSDKKAENNILIYMCDFFQVKKSIIFF